jgi:S1 RNA binding domain protein
MAEIGNIARGTVVRVLLYGALVRLDDGSLGLVHISEIDDKYVRNIGEYVAEGARVVVKVIGEKEGNRYEFSMKKAKDVQLEDEIVEDFGSNMPVLKNYNAVTRAAFDDKLREFISDSTDRLSDIKRHNDQKLGLRRR